MRYRLFLLLFLAATEASAGAWTQAKGDGLFIITGRYYAADEYYDNNGHRLAQPDYDKYEFAPYLEYGILDGLTAGANLSLQRVHQESPETTNYGLGDSEFFMRLRLYQQGGLVVSAEPLVKLPSPESARNTPALGGQHPDAGINVAVGYGFTAWRQQHFIDLSAGYRYRFGEPEDQLRASATLGIGITPEWTIMPQAFLTYRLRDPSVASFTQSSGDDYDLVTLQLSAVYKVNEKLSLQAGAFTHIDGTNTGSGSGILVSVWKKF